MMGQPAAGELFILMKEGTVMHYVLDQLNQCTGCTACRTVCTKNAVSMTQDPAQRCG